MALIQCPECGQQHSSDALACPSCGKPNKTAKVKEQNSKQGTGCLIFILGIPLCFVFPPLGGIMVIVGIVIALINTRVK